MDNVENFTHIISIKCEKLVNKLSFFIHSRKRSFLYVSQHKTLINSEKLGYNRN